MKIIQQFLLYILSAHKKRQQSSLSVHENNQKRFILELDDISANIVALKSFLISEIYDLRQELNQPIKSVNKQEDYTELKIQMRYIQRENQFLRKKMKTKEEELKKC